MDDQNIMYWTWFCGFLLAIAIPEALLRLFYRWLPAETVCIDEVLISRTCRDHVHHVRFTLCFEVQGSRRCVQSGMSARQEWRVLQVEEAVRAWKHQTARYHYVPGWMQYGFLDVPQVLSPVWIQWYMVGLPLLMLLIPYAIVSVIE